MPNVDRQLRAEPSAQAQRFGRRFGEWCWCTLIAVPRVVVVALVLAVGYRHFVPDFPLGAAFVMFLAANVVTSPIPWLVRRTRRPSVPRK